MKILNGGAFSSLEDYLLYGGSLLDSKKQNFITHALSCLTQRALKSLDTSKWAEFRIGDLFEIHTGRDVIIGRVENGTIPLISHQNNNNNGVAKYIKKLDNRILFDHKTTISLADRGVFCAFTQSQDFHIGTRVKALIFKNKNLSKEVRLFFVVAINMLQVKFIEYAQNATDKLPDLQILLPVLPPDSTKAESVNDKYNIDFAFMESFIKEIEKEHFLSLIEYYHKEMSVYNEVLETNGGH